MKNLFTFLMAFAFIFSNSNLFAQETPQNTDEEMVKEQMQEMLGAMMGGMADVELPGQYDFDFAYKMKIIDPEDTYEMTWMFSKSKEIFGMSGFNALEEVGQSLSYMVMDRENKVMVSYVLHEGKKKAIKMPDFSSMSESQVQADMEDLDNGKMTVTKTENNPVILGKKCVEYRVEHADEEEYTIMAMDESSPIKWIDIFDKMGGMEAESKPSAVNMFKKGMMMHTQTYDKNSNKLISEMEVVEIDENPASIKNGDWDFKAGF